MEDKNWVLLGLPFIEGEQKLGSTWVPESQVPKYAYKKLTLKTLICIFQIEQESSNISIVQNLHYLISDIKEQVDSNSN